MIAGQPTLEDIRVYYDERVDGKLRDFTQANPRIEAAIQLIAEWSPAHPRRILEIGCGIGATAWRMARAWPRAEVIGSDVSVGSIEVARTCFQRPNLTYQAGLIKKGVLKGTFDLIVLMDVYEHIAPADRPVLHAALKSLLSEDSRLILTVPTPALQAASADSSVGLQPIDEDIDLDEIETLREDTQTDLLLYRKVGVWNYGDYAHLVLGRYQELAPVARRQHRPQGLAALKRHLKGFFGETKASVGLVAYLGADVGRLRPWTARDRFGVPLAERRRLASAWCCRERKSQ